jgi:plastocyanin
MLITDWGCKKSTTHPSSSFTTMGGENSVMIQNYSFNPASITVSPNTTVTWINDDNVTHTVTSNTGVFNSGNISGSGGYVGGGTYSFKFTTKGAFPYHCSIHTMMTGTVVVQ